MRDTIRAILPAVIFATAAPGAAAEKIQAGSLAALDRDGDGYVDRAEFRDAVRIRFSAIDSDRSGSITRRELRSYAFKHLLFKARDPILSLRHRPKNPPFDANGEMSFNAFAHMLATQRFDAADTDHNGRVSRAEARAAER
ncbi:EF-hand domain-containing protein [Sphingomonas sp. BT-65]|uniref:EF-hand domain-containing protein n=1 Tax=Sphingomonas sp. BT-65 TaxID=2989821 RepID=UPI002236ACC2|nr:EF-hand domain-containing protein [Sphingomonas sp. BT-65]MCW4460678.1 EF-hand domain-containing protein [Sphingomonas sp. BT-65]